VQHGFAVTPPGVTLPAVTPPPELHRAIPSGRRPPPKKNRIPLQDPVTGHDNRHHSDPPPQRPTTTATRHPRATTSAGAARNPSRNPRRPRPRWEPIAGFHAGSHVIPGPIRIEPDWAMTTTGCGLALPYHDMSYHGRSRPARTKLDEIANPLGSYPKPSRGPARSRLRLRGPETTDRGGQQWERQYWRFRGVRRGPGARRQAGKKRAAYRRTPRARGGRATGRTHAAEEHTAGSLPTSSSRGPSASGDAAEEDPNSARPGSRDRRNRCIRHRKCQKALNWWVLLSAVRTVLLGTVRRLLAPTGLIRRFRRSTAPHVGR